MNLSKLITFWELKGMPDHQYSNERLSDTLDGELRKIHIQKRGYYADVYYTTTRTSSRIKLVQAKIYDAFVGKKIPGWKQGDHIERSKLIHINKARVKDLEEYFV